MNTRPKRKKQRIPLIEQTIPAFPLNGLVFVAARGGRRSEANEAATYTHLAAAMHFTCLKSSDLWVQICLIGCLSH